MNVAGEIGRQDGEATARLEQQALEKMARVLCDHTQQLASDARSRGVLGSREASLQEQVFAERRQQALQLLEAAAPRSDESRMARLEKLIQALQFSHTLFPERIDPLAAPISVTRAGECTGPAPAGFAPQVGRIRRHGWEYQS